MGGDGNLQLLVLAGGKLFGLCEAAEAPGWFSQGSLRSLAVGLDYLFPGHFSGIGDLYAKLYALSGGEPVLAGRFLLQLGLQGEGGV